MSKTETKSLDLASFDRLRQAQEEGTEVSILDPRTGDDLGIRIRVCGPDSDRQKKAVQKQVDARLRRRSTAPLTAEELDADGLRLLANCILSWSEIVVDSASLEFSVDNAVKLMQRFPFIREQIDVVAGNRAGFTKS